MASAFLESLGAVSMGQALAASCSDTHWPDGPWTQRRPVDWNPDSSWEGAG
jgi:hypothetical protein